MIWEAGRGRVLFFVLILACLAGCKSLFGTQGPPDDPLFLNKKPVEAKAESSRPVAPGYSEPMPPINPYKAVAVSATLEPEEESQ